MERRLREGHLKRAYSPTVAAFFGQINAKSGRILKRIESMFHQEDEEDEDKDSGGSAVSSSSSSESKKSSPVVSSFSSSTSTSPISLSSSSEITEEEALPRASAKESPEPEQLIIYQKTPVVTVAVAVSCTLMLLSS